MKAALAFAFGMLVLTIPTSGNTSVGTEGAVSSRSMLATNVGLEVLQEGGNAVDAAVATAFALAVTYPAAGNIGGGGFMVIHLPDGTVVTNDHRERAPMKASRDMFLVEGEYAAELALASHLSSGVPGSVHGLLSALERYGKMDRARVLAPAINLAENGFALPEDIARRIALRKDTWSRHPSSAKVFLKMDGSTYDPNENFAQPDLALTLRRISAEGVAGFYKGETAKMIVQQMATNDGLISEQDLANYSSEWRSPIKGSYKDYEIYSMPPPSSGGVLLVQMLNMLESMNLSQYGFGSVETMHAMIEVERRAYADRSQHLGDSDFYPVPIETLISKAYAKERIADFDPTKASTSADTSFGQIPLESEETTHLSVYQKDGFAVSLTTTINTGYGSGIVVEGAGFLLNNEMDDFSAKPGTPNVFGLVGAEANAIEPGKRMLSSMTPTIVKKDGDVVLVTGTPGGSTIITSILQVVLNVIEHGQTIEQSVASPRFHHQWLPDFISMENGFDESVIDRLKERGHINWHSRPVIGDVNQIGVADTKIIAVSDPRNAGSAAAY